MLIEIRDPVAERLRTRAAAAGLAPDAYLEALLERDAPAPLPPATDTPPRSSPNVSES